MPLFKLENLEKHPFNKTPGKEYFYLKGINIERATLLKMKIELVHKPDKFSVEGEKSEETVIAYFSYKMENGDNPKRLFEDKQYLINEITNNINK